MFFKLFLLIILMFLLPQCGTGICSPLQQFCSSSQFENSLVFPSTNRSVWIDDEISKRTVTLLHSAESIECSRNAGITFSNCDSNSTFIWNVSDYNVEHIVRFTSGENTENLSFTPSSKFPAISFVTCDQEVLADENFTTFEGRTTIANDVICISDGVTISNNLAEDDININAAGITIIAREDGTATFESNRGSGTTEEQSVLDSNLKDNIKYIGITVTYVSGGTGHGIKLDGQNNFVEGVQITNTSGAGTAYLLLVSGGATTRHTVQRYTGTAVNIGTPVFVSTSGEVDIYNSTLTGGNNGLRVSNFSVATLNNSVVSNSSGATSEPIEVFRGELSLNNVTIEDGSGSSNGSIYLDATLSTTTLNIENTIIKRLTTNSGNINNAIKINTGGTVLINSSGNNNTFCHINGGVVTFANVLTEAHSGTFVVSNQVNNGTIATCE